MVMHPLQNPSKWIKAYTLQMSLKSLYTKGLEIRGLADSDVRGEASSSCEWKCNLGLGRSFPLHLVGGLGARLTAQTEAFPTGQDFHVKQKTVKIVKQREKTCRCGRPSLLHEGVGVGRWAQGAFLPHLSCHLGRPFSQWAIIEHLLCAWPSGSPFSLQDSWTKKEV